MSGKNINCEDKKIKKCDFYKSKKEFNIDEIDVDKIWISEKEPYGTNKSIKCFIGYSDDVIRPLCIELPQMIGPLCIELPQMIGCVKCCDSNKTMSFKVTDKKLLKNYTKIWEKVSNLMDLKFDSEPVYGHNDKYIKTKIKIYRDKVNTDFQGKKVPKENSSYKCFSLIMLDSFIKASKKYYPQTLLEEWKYEAIHTKMENY